MGKWDVKTGPGRNKGSQPDVWLRTDSQEVVRQGALSVP